jgi:hypothetical protein
MDDRGVATGTAGFGVRMFDFLGMAASNLETCLASRESVFVVSSRTVVDKFST